MLSKNFPTLLGIKTYYQINLKNQFWAHMSCPLQNLKPKKRITAKALTIPNEKSSLS